MKTITATLSLIFLLSCNDEMIGYPLDDDRAEEKPHENGKPVWQDFGNGSASWGVFLSFTSVTLRPFGVSNWLVDNISSPHVGIYNFSVSISGTVGGANGRTGQLFINFLDDNHKIISSSDPIDMPNAGFMNESISATCKSLPKYVMIQVSNSTELKNTIIVKSFSLNH